MLCEGWKLCRGEKMKIIDISHKLDGNTPVYPGDFDTELTIFKTLENDFYNAFLLQTCLHTGTHIDIPMHLMDSKKTVAEYEADCFIGEGVLINAQGENLISMKPQYEEIVREGSIVLIYTGFDVHYCHPMYFRQYPVISCELANFFVERRVKMIGTDTPAPDYTPFDIHKLLLANDIFILENLTNLKALDGIGRFEVFALPLKIAAEASFVRAVCRVV